MPEYIHTLTTSEYTHTNTTNLSPVDLQSTTTGVDVGPVEGLLRFVRRVDSIKRAMTVKDDTNTLVLYTYIMVYLYHCIHISLYTYIIVYLYNKNTIQ